MKALVLKEYKRLEFENAPEPEVAPDAVLVSVKACGICGSDVHGMDGSTGRRQPPVIMGHEAAGVIARVGQNVKHWNPGDRVTFDSMLSCGECDFCREKQFNLCDRRRVLGVSCGDYRQHGAFAEFVAVPERVLYRVPDGMPLEHAAMTEPLSIAFHAVRRTNIGPADAVAVVGAGVIGLMIIQTLRLRGCKQIIAVDLAPEKLALALKVGATDAITPAEGVEKILQLTDGRGCDVALEAVGITATVDLALQSVRKGGAVVLVGNVAPKIQFPLQIAVTREISVLGSCASAGEYPDCLEALAKKKIDVTPMISAIAPLAEGANWFNRLYAKEPGLVKVILQP